MKPRVTVLLCVAAAAHAEAGQPPSAGIQAFYILFSDQITREHWPQKLCQNAGKGPQGSECVDARLYKDGIFIASPQNMTSALIKKVKSDVPGSKVVAYWDFSGMALLPANESECPFCQGHIRGDRAGRNCSTTYHCGPSAFLSALQATFPKELATHDITDGLPGVMVSTYPGLAHYVWNNRSAPLLAKFLGKWLTDHGFDGLYVDGALPPPLDFCPAAARLQCSH